MTQAVPTNISNLREWLRKLTTTVNLLVSGKMNCVGTVTLTANAASTVVSEAEGRISNVTAISLMPFTSNAAAELGAGTMYVSAVNSIAQTFTIVHANNAQTDRTFRYALIG